MRYLLLFSCLSVLPAFSQAQNDPHAVKIKELVAEYSITGHHVIQLFDTLPMSFKINGVEISRWTEKQLSKWVRDNEKVHNSLGTVVHESFHGLNGSLAYHLIAQNQPEAFNKSDDYSVYFTDSNQPLLVKHGGIYNSHLLLDKISPELRAHRYKRYIQQPSGVGAQVHGIYGLMEEWNAYYLGNRAVVDLYPYYLQISHYEPEAMIDFVHQVGGSYFAYYEFKYFILKYLETARKEYPETYTELMDNEKLKQAYTNIDTAFSALIREFRELLVQMETDLADYTEVVTVKLEQGYVIVNTRGAGIFQEEVDKFQEALNRRSLRKLDEIFRMK